MPTAFIQMGRGPKYGSYKYGKARKTGSRAVVFVSMQLAKSTAKEWVVYSCKGRGR